MKVVRNDAQLRLTRTFNAPVELVYQTWTEPEHIARWWGPDGFRTTIHVMEVWPGGRWELTLHGPDGKDYHNKKVYDEVVRPSRLAFTNLLAPKHIMSADFTEEEPGKTRIDIRMDFESAPQLDDVIRVFRADEGLAQNMERLEVYLRSLV